MAELLAGVGMSAVFILAVAVVCVGVQVGAIVWFGIVTIRAGREAGQ